MPTHSPINISMIEVEESSMQREMSLPFSEKHTNLIVMVLLCLYPLIGMGIDLIAPSLPAISLALHTSSSFSKNLITLYLLGAALGNFFIGFLSDALGRRKLLLLGLFIFVIASLFPAWFAKPMVLLLGRFFQGFAIAFVAVIGRAILSDILSQEKLMRAVTLIATMWGIGPIIGPVIGGYLQVYLGWQACFYFFACMGAWGLLAALFILPETHFARQPLQFQLLKRNFVMILSHRVFLGIITLMGVNYSLLIVFNTLGPFLIQKSLGYSPIYFGQMALWLGLTFLLGTLVCRHLLRTFRPEQILLYIIPFCVGIAFISVIAAYMSNKNIVVIIISSLFMFFGCGIIYPTAMGKGLSLFRHLAGSSSAVMSLVLLLITSLIAFVMSYLHVSDVISITLIYLGLMLLAGIIYYFLIHPRE